MKKLSAFFVILKELTKTKNQTDLTGIKNLAKTFLMLDIETTPLSPIIVTHPFTDSGIVGFSGDNKPENILKNHDALLRWQKAMNKQINESDSATPSGNGEWRGGRIASILTNEKYNLVF